MFFGGLGWKLVPPLGKILETMSMRWIRMGCEKTQIIQKGISEALEHKESITRIQLEENME